ncbi:MAG: STAS domain-containing protein [Bifidobacteriaceae bacterium]|jgi:anti-anti-sigma factor|nr:STAS domain-containing protein [Bifidobacteriaceae bacterium]
MTSTNGLEITVDGLEGGDSAVTVMLVGSLDTTTVEEAQKMLLEVLEKLEIGDITVDFSELTYISSAGLRVMLLLNKEATDKNIKLKLRDMRQSVREVFDMVGFTALFTVE